MCITNLVTKQLETLGYEIDYNTQANEQMELDYTKGVTDKCTNNKQKKLNKTSSKQTKELNNSDIKFE